MRTESKWCGVVLCFMLSFSRVSSCGKSKSPEPWDPCDMDGVKGACVPLPECSQYVVLLKNPATTLEGLRITRARRCGYHEMNSKVCCPTNEPLVSSTSPTVTSTPQVDEGDFIEALPLPGDCGSPFLNGLPIDSTNNSDVFPLALPPPPLAGAWPQFDPAEYRPVLTFSSVSDLQPNNTTDNERSPFTPFQPPPIPYLTPYGPADGTTPNYPPPAISGGKPVHSRDNDSKEASPDYIASIFQSSKGFDPDKKYAVAAGKPVLSRDMALWMALLGYKNSAVFWKCGGSIISSRHVLTAAHCIKPNLYIVRVGEIDLATDVDKGYTPIDFLVKKAIAHEDYTKYHNDIGIVVLQEKIDFATHRHIAPVCLASSPSDEMIPNLKNVPSGLITGWGETEIAGERPSHLLYAYVTILGNQHCADAYRDKNVTIDERVLCAGDRFSKTDACNGDSGGPLVRELYPITKNTPFRRTYYQLGVVSYGFRCSAQRHTGVYTNVLHFMPWIEKKVLGTPGPWATGA